MQENLKRIVSGASLVKIAHFQNPPAASTVMDLWWFSCELFGGLLFQHAGADGNRYEPGQCFRSKVPADGHWRWPVMRAETPVRRRFLRSSRASRGLPVPV